MLLALNFDVDIFVSIAVVVDVVFTDVAHVELCCCCCCS